MEKIVTQIIELAKNDRKVLCALKRIAVDAQKYELASEIRQIEIDKYPKCNTGSDEYKEAELFIKACKMAEVNIKEIKTSYILLQLSKLFIEKKDALDIKAISKILANSEEIFG